MLNQLINLVQQAWARVFRRSWRLLLAIVFLLAFAVSQLDWFSGSDMPDLVKGMAIVRDGDSLQLSRHRIRLAGIDAPELEQRCRKAGRHWNCGRAAGRHLERLIGNHSVLCRLQKRDQFDRLLAFCSVAGRDLNQAMVRDGMAVSFGQTFAREEQAARAVREGLWAGTFERPQVWRRRNPRN